MRLIPFILALFFGAWFGFSPKTHFERKNLSNIHPEKDFPLVEHKSFVVVVYAHNNELWCERALKSIFEQDYDHYRVIVIDDASIDQTYQKATDFILKNNQDEKVILIRNQEKLGPVACLYRAVDSCLDKEIMIPIDAKDWLSSPINLSRLNLAYQNPDVWMTFHKMLHYPSYEIQKDPKACFYAGLFKRLQLEDLFQKGTFQSHFSSYQTPLLDLAGGRVKDLEDPVRYCNQTIPFKSALEPSETVRYSPLKNFPKQKQQESKTDLVIFSYDRPMQLYACLESVQRYMSGLENLTVFYRVSNEYFETAYDSVRDAFPKMRFVMQSIDDPKHDFKPKLNQIVFGSPSEYVLFAVDDIIVKDFVDLKYCMDQLEKTGAYGFYLRLGKNIDYCYQFSKSQEVPPSHPLSSGIYAWDFRSGQYDWGFATSLDMTLLRKKDLKQAFYELKYKTPNSLEYTWNEKFHPEKGIGLYFESSKLVNIPMNVVGRTGNPHMNYLNVEELLAKFNQGLKIDIEPLAGYENHSPHIDYIPEFILR